MERHIITYQLFIDLAVVLKLLIPVLHHDKLYHLHNECHSERLTVVIPTQLYAAGIQN